MVTDQEESDADSAEGHALFGLVAEVCGTGTVTMDDYEADDDDVVTCHENTSADILKLKMPPVMRVKRRSTMTSTRAPHHRLQRQAMQ